MISLKVNKWSTTLFVLSFLLGITELLMAQTNHKEHILVVSSYIPNTSNFKKSIDDFPKEYKLLGGESSVVLRTLDCTGYGESCTWAKRLNNLISEEKSKYTIDKLVLMGQEAWAAYNMIAPKLDADYKVFVGQVSNYYISLPEDCTRSKRIHPKVNFFKLHNDTSPFVAGLFYKYDVPGNIDLIKRYYPQTKHIAFISDNTYGGVAMQAYVKAEMENYSEYTLDLLDGRNLSFNNLVSKLKHLEKNTVILFGSWRIDKDNVSYMRSASYVMKEASGDVPMVSLTGQGIDNWAIGTSRPLYCNQGKELAELVYKFEKKKPYIPFEIITCTKKINYPNFKKAGFDEENIPTDATFVNQPKNPFRCELLVVCTVLAFMITLIISIRSILRNRIYVRQLGKQKEHLEKDRIQLIEAKQKADKLERLKIAFLANIGHKIRTPLDSIIESGDLIVENNNLSHNEVLDYLKNIKDQSHLLLDSINNMFDLSRLKSKTLGIYINDCEVIFLCKECIEIMENEPSYIKKKNRFHFKSHVSKLYIQTDFLLLKQVVCNLIQNANKFTENGEIHLTVKDIANTNLLLFTVLDTGIGIPEDKHEIVFEYFEKLDKSTNGVGLGLSFSKAIVEKLGGEIWIDKEVTLGTKICFTIPQKKAQTN